MNFVAELRQDDGIRSRSASARSGGFKSRSNSINVTQVDKVESQLTTGFALALVNVSPQLDGELAFQTGDLIEITNIVDDDWMIGRCHNKEGLVSAVCVELIEDNTEDVNSKAQDDVSLEINSQCNQSESALYQNVNDESIQMPSEVVASEDKKSDISCSPHGRIVCTFTAQTSSELSVEENQTVQLIQHVDSDWTECEIDGRAGLIPTSFIEIIVDCPSVNETEKDLNSLTEETSSIKSESNLISSNAITSDNKISVEGSKEIRSETLSSSDVHEIGLVTFTFTAQLSSDVSVSEGDTVEVTRRVDDNWLEVQTESGHNGLVPLNHIQIIGPWPKSNSRSGSLTEESDLGHQDVRNLHQSKSQNTAVTENSTEQCESVSLSNNQGETKFTTVETEPASHLSKANTDSRRLSLPARDKPPLLPKPALLPKPKKVSTQSSLLQSEAKFSQNRRHTLRSLDTLIEDEIEKEQTRSESSQKPNLDIICIDKSLDIEEKAFQGKEIDIETTLNNERNNNQSNSVLNSFDPLQSTNGITDSISDTCKNHEAKTSSLKRKPMLTASVSMNEGNGRITRAHTIKRFNSFSEGTGEKDRIAAKDSKRLSYHQSTSSAFENPAFQMEVDEGHLISVTAGSLPPNRPPAPGCSTSLTQNPSGLSSEYFFVILHIGSPLNNFYCIVFLLLHI